MLHSHQNVLLLETILNGDNKQKTMNITVSNHSELFNNNGTQKNDFHKALLNSSISIYPPDIRNVC